MTRKLRSGSAGKIMKNFRYLTRVIIGRYQNGLEILRLYPLYRNRVVNSATDICIEGFPRSGNSFFVNVFRYWNPETRIAHHIHVPAQVIRAVSLNIPCIVLVRNPVDVIASLLIIDERLSLKVALFSYIDFYRRLLPLKTKVIFTYFDEATNNPETVIEKVNDVYGTKFKYGELTAKLIKEIFIKLKNHHNLRNQPAYQVAIPLEEKHDLKSLYIPRIQEHPLFKKANEIYAKIKEG